MMPLLINWFPSSRVNNYRPRFFCEREWYWYVRLMPPLVVLANYYFIGSAYFRDPFTFLVGTTLAVGLYWLSVILVTLTVRWSIRRYPGMQQTVPRTLLMLTSVGVLTIGLAVVYVWTYSVLSVTGIRFSWLAVRPVWAVGLLSDAFLCIALGLFYTYSQWKLELQEDEHLQRQALQSQYDTLKGQLNPHFLFNALNSVSALIGEEPKQAEEFVDKMARVYRYMLQSGRPNDQSAFVTLQAELEFISLYADLLQVRYQTSLRINQPLYVSSMFLTRSVLPLSLLTLVDNAVKHNAMSIGKPLVICIDVTSDGWLQVTNNRQQRTIRLEAIRAGLVSLVARYELLSPKAVVVEATDDYFKVALPLLTF